MKLGNQDVEQLDENGKVVPELQAETGNKKIS